MKIDRQKTQISYSQIVEVRAIPRGFGSWGDMVLVLKDSSRIEMRSIPSFRDAEEFILKQINKPSPNESIPDAQGFAA